MPCFLFSLSVRHRTGAAFPSPGPVQRGLRPRSRERRARARPRRGREDGRARRGHRGTVPPRGARCGPSRERGRWSRAAWGQRQRKQHRRSQPHSGSDASTTTIATSFVASVTAAAATPAAAPAGRREFGEHAVRRFPTITFGISDSELNRLVGRVCVSEHGAMRWGWM